jgi:hypothetical protein
MNVFTIEANLGSTKNILREILMHGTVLTKITEAKKRTSHAGCNACDARFRRVLHRICYLNVAHMKRASCVHTRGMRTSDAFVARVSSIHCRCRALLARRKCAGPWVTFGQYCIQAYLGYCDRVRW